MNKGFNLPEGREGFKRIRRTQFLIPLFQVSIYPKAEKGLREDKSDVLIKSFFGFNLPEGREGFKSLAEHPLLLFHLQFQSTRRQRRV